MTFAPCAICGKPQQYAYKPFCSRRCADVDLGRWFGGGYVIAGREEHSEDGSSSHREDER